MRRAIRRPARRGGYIYLVVMGVAIIVAMIGLSAMMLARMNLKAAQGNKDWNEARLLATTAAEYALAKINNDTTWRSTHLNNVEYPQSPSLPIAMGGGTITYKLVDEKDGIIAGNAAAGTDKDPVRVYGIGRVGKAVRVHSVNLQSAGTALDVLRTAAHTNVNLTAKTTSYAIDGPLSSNANIVDTGTIYGDAEAAISIASTVTVIGTKTAPAPNKPMPPATVFDQYVSRATTIPYGNLASGQINLALLSSASNPYGSTNAEGIYHIVIPASSVLTLTRSRIKATLLITANNGSTIKTQNALFWEPPQADMPSMILKALSTTATVDFNGWNGVLSESALNINFNPPGTPYNCIEDTDKADDYPVEIRGLFHVISSQTISTIASSQRVRGCFVTAGPLTIASGAWFRADPNLLQFPPSGYTTGNTMAPVIGSWRVDASP
jgi:hypothetical protein